ncbi:MAG TPA: NAD(P)H-hydrate dehydratase [Gemmataceae bacterium]|nr:NAD(P)H-hydrate dehydratase [Gemmataceae bacterium]
MGPVRAMPPDVPVTVPRLPPRPADAHKGMFGRLLVVAGSRGMSGAAALSATAGLRGGAGLVQVAVPGDILPIVAGGNPCYMTAPFAHDDRGRLARAAIDEIISLASTWADVVALGPGLGQSEAMPELVSAMLGRVEKPLVIDADGLNALARIPAEAWRKHRAPVVLTPHPGEFARLSGRSSDEVRQRREELAIGYAAQQSVVLVLKGHATIVTDGRRVYRNATGNPGMATGGTGDVLTGLIGALIGQGLAPFEAAVLGVWAHGRAGDLAAAQVGQTALIATDLLAHLPAALREAGG